MKNLLNYSNIELSEALNIDINKAIEIKKVIEISINAMDYKSVINWVNQCYNTPSAKELQMCAINEILSGYGVESVTVENMWINSYYQNICATYVNLGDTYMSTVLLDHITGKFVITSWGDFYESLNMAE
jgi:hypothetical protein